MMISSTVVRWAVGLGIGILGVQVAEAQPFPTNNNPANQIRFATRAAADARRLELIKFIWQDGLPKTRPQIAVDVRMPNEAFDINPQNVTRIDRLDVDVSDFDFHSISYLFHPKNVSRAHRVVIVHQGHSSNLEAGVGATADHLLQNGFTVLAMKMPLYNWSEDATATIPSRGEVRFKDHNDLLAKVAPSGSGVGFRLFLEPVVQCINHLVAADPQLLDISMIGLSGGGWTTSMMAAIDERIRLSVPVAGSAPLYIRNSDASSVGDAEQYWPALYAENIQEDGAGGGVCTWLEIYALGGFGERRQQIHVSNEFDSCCFSGRSFETYRSIVAQKVADLGAGQWQHVLDSSHHTHKISGHVIEAVIDPALEISKPIPSSSGLPIVALFDNQTNEFPDHWSHDHASGRHSTTVEKEGVATIRGRGLASIICDAPINPQSRGPITMKIKIKSISEDNFGGVFLTDDFGRGHQLGILFNPATKQLAVNADRGDGFQLPGDRLELGAIPDYHGGEITMSLTFDADGFSVQFESAQNCRYESGRRSWTEIPNGFAVSSLGDHAHVFIQSFDTDQGSEASMTVESISIAAAPASAAAKH